MAKSNIIYLDYAASASPNPSSIHIQGLEARKKLQIARSRVASILSSRPTEIIFTSGGTESNNLAIQGVVWNFYENNYHKKLKKIPHLITINIEHPSVLETFKMLQKRKLAEISIVSVEKNGIVDPKKIKKEIKKNTVLVSVMYANNEIGTIQPIREIAKEIRHFRKSSKGILWKNSRTFPVFHTDAVQAVNYLDLNVEKLGVDLLSLSGSKIVEAGKVGVLYKRSTVKLSSILKGGDQEFGLRPGTENLFEIEKFSKGLELTQKNKKPASTSSSLGGKESERLIKLRNYFLKKLQKISKASFGTGMIINGDLENRLPNNINITFPKIPSELLVIELSAKKIMVSSKSACKSSQKDGSYVIRAIHPELEPENGGVRFSFGNKTTKFDIDQTIKALNQILKKLKKWYTHTPI